jgi:ribosomal protein L7/L12
MENLGTYFLIALAIGWIIYYSKKKKTSPPKAKASAKPRAAAASKPSAKKPATKKGAQGPKKEKTEIELLGSQSKAGTKKSQPSPALEVSDFDLLQATQQKMREGNKLEAVKFVMNRTGWGLKKAKDYCDKLEKQNPTLIPSTAAPKNDGKELGAILTSLNAGISEENQSKSSNNSLDEFDLLLAELTSESSEKETSKSQESSKVPSSPEAPSKFDLEHEVKQLQARTGWDYAKAKAYCEQVVQYHQKIAGPAGLKNK